MNLMGRSILIVTGVLAAVASPVVASCPDSVCDCLGEAKNFDALASGQLGVSFGTLKQSGSASRTETEIQGAVCGSIATVGGDADEAPTSVGDVVGRASSGSAVKFKGVKVSGVIDPGVDVSGDVATGGGLIVNQNLAVITGLPDTSGSHPLVASCTQGAVDLQSAASTLAALPATQTIPAILAKGGGDQTTEIVAGPGVNVISVPGGVKVVPLSVDGSPEGSELTVTLDSATAAVIINTPKLSIGKTCTVSVTGDADRVIINVTSAAGVKVSQEASVDPMILAPQSTVTALATAETSNLYGRKVVIKGASVAGSCSPSGAFLDPADSLL